MENGKSLILFEDFKRHMESIQRLIEFENQLQNLLRNYKNSRDEIIELSFPSLIANVIDLLSVLTHDTNDWISYWVFELECGAKYKDGCVSDENNINIPLKTIEDLWNILKHE